MRTDDRRDDRLGEALDRAVRDLRADPAPERAMRRGTWRRAGRIAAALVTVAAFLGGASWAAIVVGDDEATPDLGSDLSTFASLEAPWTFAHPSSWDVATTRSEGPERMANMLRSTIANGPLPGGSGGLGVGDERVASSLGDEGAVVIVERFWSHSAPLDCDVWGPRTFAADASNPGWEFRERHRSEGTLCFAVLEWFGPEASDADRAAAAAVADSVRLGDLERWTETDGLLTTLHDEGDGFTITFPADWLPSAEPINTWVCSPYEILALATYPLRPGGEAVIDSQVPSLAIEDLGPNDTMIWLNEDGSTCDGGTPVGGSNEGFPPRPHPMGPFTVCRDAELCPDPDGLGLGIPRLRAWWFYFGDQGRGIYVFVGMGEEAFADDARVQLAWDVLDSLRFLPH